MTTVARHLQSARRWTPLQRWIRPAIPYVQQMSMADCGAACLAMVLRGLGRHVRLDEVRTRLGSTRDGVSARKILDTARDFGLRGRGVRVEVDELDLLPPGAILHWRFSHFVVLESVRGRKVTIVDPAVGRRGIEPDEVARDFTGVALVFEKTAAFAPREAARSRVWQYVRAIANQSGLLTRIFALTAIAQLFGLALPLLTGMLVDRVIPQHDANLLRIGLAGIAAVTLFDLFGSWIRSLLFLRLRTELDARMSLDFLDHLVRLPYSFFQIRKTGDLMMRLGSNTAIREILTSSALSVVLDGLAVLGYLAVLLLAHWRIGLLVVMLGSLRLLVYLVSRRRVGELAAESLVAEAESSSFQVQMLEGIESLKTAGAEHRAAERWSHLFVNVLNVSVRSGRLNAAVESVLGAIQGASPLLVLGYGGHLVLQGELSLGMMLAISALAAGFLGPLSSLLSMALRLQTIHSYVDRVDEVFDQAPEQNLRATHPAHALAGAIRLEGVSFRYDSDGEWALRDVDVDVRPGERVAIVGRSGSGKSTLARILVGLHVPTEGRILYDGHDLAGLELRSLRRQVGFVPQFPYIFSDTVAQNIALQDPDLDPVRVHEALRLAALEETLARMPMGLNTRLNAGGGSLSGGELQRIALARALATQPKILVLDEATSSLDAVTERAIHENLRALECTRVIIAHRLSTVKDADRILVLEAGRLVESGTHDALMREGGVYAGLVRNQLGRECDAVSARA